VSPLPAKASHGSATPPRRGNAALLALVLVVTFVTAADLLLKRGANAASTDNSHGILSTLGLTAMISPYTLAGIVFHLAGLAAWLYALRHLPLTLAFCFTALEQATIALGAWLWLGELISPLRWVGIGTIMIGVLLLVPSIVKSEQRTDAPHGAGEGGGVA
jgi:undecaprenyl phosphate-alpha-L-ara4N flippase subunit ArnF